MRVKFTSPFDYVTLRTKSGTPRATVAYMPTDEPITVKSEHGEAAVKAGKAVEVDEVATRRDSDAAGIIEGLKSIEKPGRAKGGLVTGKGPFIVGEK